MMKPLLEQIKAGSVLVGDGAMGTMLLERGLIGGKCPEELNLTHSSELADIARRYLESGADILQTNTFGASPLKLRAYGLDEQVEAINRNAVKAVKEVAGDCAYVSGSCGPTGAILEPYGDAHPDEVFEGFLRQASSLIDEGVDLIVVETMIDINEATLAVKAAKEVSSSVPVAATMTFDQLPRGFYTVMGVNIEQAIQGLTEAGADIVGSNCGNGIDKMVSITAEFRKHTSLPLLIQSNAGIPELKNGQAVYSESPQYMAERVHALLSSNVSIIGGCCGTTPEHIRAIRDVVKDLTPSGAR